MGKMKDNICKEDKFIDNNNYSYNTRLSRINFATSLILSNKLLKFPSLIYFRI